jgi:hypothetical protein
MTGFLLGAAVTLALVTAWALRRSWRRAHAIIAVTQREAEDQAIALTRPPVPGSLMPSPVRGHDHGGIAATIRMYRCGCVHCHDGRGAITEVIPCWGPTDLDREIRDLLS